MFGKSGKTAPTAPNRRTRTPKVALWALRIGGGLAIICGAILSFYALFGLAVLNGWPASIAWALPGSVDILTTTALVVAMALPRSHPGAHTAHWCAGISLVITVTCNVLFHALRPAHWSAGHIALVATGAVPAIVVELILIMQMRIGDGAALAETDAVPTATNRRRRTADDAPRAATDGNRATASLDDADENRRPPSDQTDDDESTTPTVTTNRSTAETDDGDDAQARIATVTNLGDRRRGDADWARIAAPHYRAYARANGGKGPSGPKLALMLKDAGHELLSDSRAREIRRATEQHLKDNPTDETERAGQVA